MPVKLQLDKQMRQSWDAHLVAAIVLGGRRMVFWAARRWPRLALTAVLAWLGWLAMGWLWKGVI